MKEFELTSNQSRYSYELNKGFRYRLKDMGSSSHKYGPCEVCKGHVSEVYYQAEERYCRIDYIDTNDGGYVSVGFWSQYQTRSYFGHNRCLASMRRNGLRKAFDVCESRRDYVYVTRGDGTSIEIDYEWGLAGSAGAYFILKPTAEASDEDIKAAKECLRDNRDVVSLRVLKPESPTARE